MSENPICNNKSHSTKNSWNFGSRNQVEPKIVREKISGRSSTRGKKMFSICHWIFSKIQSKKCYVIWKSLPGFPPPHQGSLEKRREESDPGQISKQIAEIRAGSLSRLPRSRAVISKCTPSCWLGWVGFFSYCPHFSKASTLHILNRLGVFPLPG